MGQRDSMKKNETLLTELFELDELTACQELAENLMAGGAKSSAPYYYWVKVELEKESPNYLNAKRYLQLGQKRSAEKGPLYFLFGQLMEEEGRYDLALHYYEQGRGDEQADFAQAKLLFLLEEDLPKAKILLENLATATAESCYFLAAIALEEGEYLQGISLLSPICNTEFEEDCFELLCRLYIAFGEGEKALSYLKTLTEKAADPIGYMSEYAQLLQDLKQDLAAAQAWCSYHNSLQQPQMSQDRIFLEKAQDFYALGLHEGALFFCEQANRHQLSVEGLRMQTKLYKVTGALDKVEDCLQEMAQFYPGMDIAAFSSSMEKNNLEDK